MSLTYIGAYVALLAGLLGLFGIEIENDRLTQIVTGIVALIGAVIAIIGRYRKGGVNIMGIKPHA